MTVLLHLKVLPIRNLRFMKKITIFFAGLVLACQGLQAQIAEPVETTDKFATLVRMIEHMYVDSVDSPKLVEKAIVAMLEELDPHSVYISKEELREAEEPLQGSFDGIGVQFNILHDTITVIEPIQGGPSEKLGVQAGDQIIKIGDEVVAGVSIKNNDVFKRLRGPKGTQVSISVRRKGTDDLIVYNITRDKIPIYSLDASYIVSPGIGYIKVSRFAKTTMTELKQAIAELKEQGMKDLILDLEGNGGGLLNTAIEMSDEFLSGDKLIVFTQGRAFAREPFNANPNVKGSFEKGRLVILTDESSASASEIVSGAIQDWDRGLIIGRRSFGKGLVQRPIPLPDGSIVRLTVQKYYTPSGRCIQKPYEDGLDDYFADREERYKHGEFFSLDSIKLADSLRYYTNIQKRVVYGGGGILPDIFVPLDTSESSKYFTDLLRIGVTSDWPLEYVNKNRKDLLTKYPTFDSFVSGFVVTDEFMKEIIAKAEELKVPYDEKGYKTSEHAIKTRIKALVARNLYDGEAFFVVINELNPALKKAVQVLNDGTFDKAKLAHKDFK
jgi:carboxyl-terminal processing protease